jgi:hypothetical protein
MVQLRFCGRIPNFGGWQGQLRQFASWTAQARATPTTASTPPELAGTLEDMTGQIIDDALGNVLASTLYPAAVATFASIGWTTQDWDDLYRYFTGPAGGAAVGGPSVADWLRNPPPTFRTRPTPASIRALFARHGRQTEYVLAALVDGASERFAVTYRSRDSSPIARAAELQSGWRHAVTIGLTEPQATGWAGTGYLHSRRYRPSPIGSPASSRAVMTALITAWTTAFGPDAWLYVLAGIDLQEAVALKENGKTPTGEQLRVMAALNGHTLPAGI